MITFIEAHWAEIVAITAALWLFYKSEYWPYITKRYDQQHADTVESERSKREFLQRAQADALQSQQDINSKLIDNNLKLVNGKFDSLAQNQQSMMETIRSIHKAVEPISSLSRRMENVENSNRMMLADWSKLNEILADIDEWMAKLDSK